jgi:hypothetical protein
MNKARTSPKVAVVGGKISRKKLLGTGRKSSAVVAHRVKQTATRALDRKLVRASGGGKATRRDAFVSSLEELADFY